MNKKGMSQIVTTLIIILLSIVAIGILWVVVKNIIDKGKDEISIDAIGLDLEIERVSVDGDTLSVTVRRNPGGGSIVGINFVISDGDNSVVIRKDTTLSELGIETFTFSLSSLAVGVIKDISIAPTFLTSSGEEIIGVILDVSTSSGSGGGSEGGSGSFGEGGGSEGGGSGGSGGSGGNGGSGGSGPVCGNSLCEIGEDESSCPSDCTAGGPVCGNTVVESGETCDDGNLDSGDGCSSTCQTETGGSGTCNNDGICDATETDVSCPADCIPPAPSCDGTWDQTDIDDGNECDGSANCLSNCFCELGFGPDGTTGNCVLDLPLDTGLIFAVWPVEGDVARFRSPDLPQNQIELQDYTSYYINFSSSSETRCFRIQSASYYPDVLSSEIELLINFLIEPLANIGPAQGYDIWEAVNCGQ